ncbi:MAG: cupin domain-containing protein [Saccharospirillaceae bacterium]|nr:cupin domain-containing protein [Pseudomonadales bacterium]NRB78244.1 cupin domain-containing protein [Saccharospirillaceae bacterium]
MSIIETKNAEHYKWGKNCDGWFLVNNDNLTIIQERVLSGCSETSHYHQHSHQFFYILSGIATIEVDGKIHTLKTQQGIEVKAGQVHQLANNQATDLVFTVTSTPPSHGDKINV